MSSIDMDQYVGSAIRYITDHADEGTAVYFLKTSKCLQSTFPHRGR